MDNFKRNVKDTDLNKDASIACSSCSKKTKHLRLFGVQEENINTDVDIYTWDDFAFYKCEACNKICLIHQYRDSMETNYDANDLSWAFKYPLGLTEKDEFYLDNHIPTQVKNIHKEARKALKEKMFVLSGIGIRCMIECVCVDKRVQGKNLKIRIQKLEEQNFITKPARRVLDNLRFLGNRAAHEFETHTETELELALSITEHMIDYIYRQ